jgi:hypothetical protein
VHRLGEDGREPAEQSAVLREAAPPRERERQHSRAKAGLGQHAFHEVGGGGPHPPSHARRAEARPLQPKRHEQALAALPAPEPREAAAEEAAVELGPELLAGVLRDSHRDRPVLDGAVQRLEVDRAAVAFGAAARSSSGLATGSALRLSRTTS